MWDFFWKAKQATNCSAYKLIQPLKDIADDSAHNLENKRKQKKTIHLAAKKTQAPTPAPKTWYCFYILQCSLGLVHSVVLVLGEDKWTKYFDSVFCSIL